MGPTFCRVAAVLALLIVHKTVYANDRQLSADSLFAADHLLDVQIEIPIADWDTIRMQSRSLTEALGRDIPDSPFTYVRGNVTIDGYVVQDVGIRKKGFLGSLSSSRPSLKIKFAEYKEQSPIGGLDRLTLNNNNQDHSRMSQYLSYKVFNDSGTIAPRCNFAKVTVNGESLGIYSNVESFKRPFLKRFGDNSGALYEGTVTDFFPDLIQKFEHKNKRCADSDLAPLAELLHKKSPKTNAVDVAAIEQYLDVDAFIRYWATESLIGFWDGYTNDQNNFFMYKNPANSKLYFIPWGTDSSFVQTMPLPPYIIADKSVHYQSVLANRLYANSETRQRYHASMRDLLDNHWDEDALLSDIDQAVALISNDVRDDNRKFKSSVRKVRYFIENRRKVLMDEIKEWPVELKTGPKKPPYFESVGQGNVQFKTKWYDEKPKVPYDVGDVQLTIEIDGEPVKFKKLGGYAGPNEHEKDSEGGHPPTIVFVGKRDSDNVMLTFGIGVREAEFHSTGKDAIDVEGILIEGNPVWFFAKMVMGNNDTVWIRGTTKLSAATIKDGEAVEGEMDFHLMKMVGGKPVD